MHSADIFTSPPNNSTQASLDTSGVYTTQGKALLSDTPETKSTPAKAPVRDPYKVGQRTCPFGTPTLSRNISEDAGDVIHNLLPGTSQGAADMSGDLNHIVAGIGGLHITPIHERRQQEISDVSPL
jgi:hypothetical protein